jgi:hypothetical protein
VHQAQRLLFGDDAFSPESTNVLEDSSKRFGAPTGDIELEPQDPSATVQGVFIQFIDASTWGEEVAGTNPLEQRQLMLGNLRSFGHGSETTVMGRALFFRPWPDDDVWRIRPGVARE